MKKEKTHYYNNHSIDDDHWPTACGCNGREVGGLIDVFFEMTRNSERCKTCNKIFKKEQNEQK